MQVKVHKALFYAATLLFVTDAMRPAAHAQVGAFSDYMPSGVDDFNYATNDIVMRSIFNNAERRAKRRAGNKESTPPPSPPKASSQSTVVNFGPAPLAPRKMAGKYPAEKRVDAERTFARLLDGYHQIEARLDIPRGDMAGAMAGLVAGSLSACQDRDIPDAGFVRSIGQLRGTIAQDAHFAGLAATDKQEAYEQFAILGTMMALARNALRQAPDPAAQTRLRETGCGYLRQLGVDPDAVILTEQGFELR